MVTSASGINIPIGQTYRAPGPYDEDYRSIARREQLAQILQQQALQPIEAGSYQGIQAPISPLQGIAKVLQGYLAGQQSDEADQARQMLALKAENNKRALSNLEPIEMPQKMARALSQTNAPTNAPISNANYGEGMPPVAQPQEPVAQAMPVSPMGGTQPLTAGQAPQTGQVAPQRTQMPMLFSDPKVNAQFISIMGEQEYAKQLARTLEPTTEMKNIAAVYGVNSPEYKQYMGNVIAKQGHIPTEIYAPGAIGRDPRTNQFVFGAAKDGIQPIDLGGGRIGAVQVPGFGAAQADISGQEKFAQGQAQMATTPEPTINAAGEKVTGGTQFSNLYGTDRPPAFGAQPSAVQQQSNVTPKVLAASPVMQAIETGQNEDWRKNIAAPVYEKGQSAQKMLDSVSVLRNANPKTGWGTKLQADAANIFAAAGVKDAEKLATSAQIFEKEGAKALLNTLSLQKGTQTERDAITGEKTFVRLSDTPQATAFTLDLAQSMALQDQRKAGYFQKAADMPQVHQGKLNKISTEWSKIEGSVFDMPIGQTPDGKPITMRQKYGIQ